MSQPKKRGFANFLQEFSIPLIAGVLVALLYANLAPESYRALVAWQPFPGYTLLGHEVTLRFLVNDCFMVLFFGLAAKEITEATLPAGALNPLRKAVNPLLATAGGVLGPVAVFFLASHLAQRLGAFSPEHGVAELRRGWGVPTATDIALAWLAARAVFGAAHPAVSFLLLLAIADDAIGLVIIALFYGDAEHRLEVAWLLLVVLGMALAFGLRAAKVSRWQPYVLLGGSLSWIGLLQANLHPALALVFIVPFLPAPRTDVGMFRQEDEANGHSALHRFGHDLKLVVDLGLFFFALANAGVELATIGPLTWIILSSLVVGKTLGITACGLLAVRIGFPLPDRMGLRELAMAGFVAALGLTVALFVANAAYADPVLLGEAKMGALFSGFVGIVAVSIARPLGIEKVR